MTKCYMPASCISLKLIEIKPHDSEDCSGQNIDLTDCFPWPKADPDSMDYERTSTEESPTSCNSPVFKLKDKSELHKQTFESYIKAEPIIDAECVVCEELKEGNAAFVSRNRAVPKLLFKTFTAKGKKASTDKEVRCGSCSCGKDPTLPCCVRARAWIQMISDKTATNFDYEKYRQQYMDIIATSSENKENVAQIKRDLARTYPNVDYFSKHGHGRQALENVLLAFSKFDAQVGYVQGMNYIVGALLYHCSEEIAFWLFVSLIEDHSMRDIYSNGLSGLYKHISNIDILIRRHFVSVAAHLSNNEILTEVFASHWVFSLFSSSVPIKEMGLFFDSFFKDSWLFFYKFILHAIRIHEKRILDCKEAADIIVILKKLNEINSNQKGFFQSFMQLTWNNAIKDSSKEQIN